MSRFHDHRPDFDNLKRMIESETTVTRILPTGGPMDPPPKARRQEYDRLFAELGLSYGVSRGANGAVWFTASCIGLVSNGSCKGVVYSPAQPDPLFEVLDDAITDPRIRNGGVGYRPIEEEWYLFLEH
jgi:hypothetical protein